LDFDLLCSLIPNCSLMRFLFVRPEICLHLPSDSTSRWTPLVFSYVFPTTRVDSGLQPVRLRPCWAHIKKTPLPRGLIRWISLITYCALSSSTCNCNCTHSIQSRYIRHHRIPICCIKPCKRTAIT